MVGFAGSAGKDTQFQPPHVYNNLVPGLVIVTTGRKKIDVAASNLALLKLHLVL